MTGHRGLVIADDLTGATDTGHEFARRGAKTVVILREGVEPDDASVVVANTDSRYADPEAAQRAVAAAVRRFPAEIVYKKIDSTLRGNLTVEIDAALEAGNADCALVAPAFPGNDRCTACGYHLVEGRHVTETAAGRDPDSPVRTSHLPSLLSGSAHPIEHLGIETNARGPTAVRDAVAASVSRIPDRPPLVVCDVTHEDHLGSIASTGSNVDIDCLYVGSAGLARHVPIKSDPDDTSMDRPVTEKSGEGALGIVGSVNAATLAQVSAVPDARVVTLDVEAAVGDPEAAGRDAARWADSVLVAHGTAVMTSARFETDVETAMDAGRREDVPEREVRARLACALGESGGRGMEPTSGEGTVPDRRCDRGGGARTVGDRRAPALGCGNRHRHPGERGDRGRAAGTWVITKAGAFGREETIVNCLDSLVKNQ